MSSSVSEEREKDQARGSGLWHVPGDIPGESCETQPAGPSRPARRLPLLPHVLVREMRGGGALPQGRGGTNASKGLGAVHVRWEPSLPLPSSHGTPATGQWRSGGSRPAPTEQPWPCGPPLGGQGRAGRCPQTLADPQHAAALRPAGRLRGAADHAGRRGDGQGAGGKKRSDAEGGGRSEAALVSDILEEAKPRAGRRQWSPGAWRFRGQGSCPVWY